MSSAAELAHRARSTMAATAALSVTSAVDARWPCRLRCLISATAAADFAWLRPTIDDVGAGVRQPARHAQADAAIAAGDDGDLAGEIEELVCHGPRSLVPDIGKPG